MHKRENDRVGNESIQESAPQLKSRTFFKFYRYNKSVPQLLIRWSVQKNYITIPKSGKLERIQHNADVFDFAISDEDMKTLVGNFTES